MLIALAAAPRTSPAEWLFVLVPVLALAAGTIWLVLSGRSRGRGAAGAVERAGSSLERLTRLPGWSAAGLLVATWALLVALFGFVWDVAWHSDYGRDKQLFTVPHVLILVGLFGIGAAALASIVTASISGSRTGWRLGRVTIPFAALPLLTLSVGAVIGFPLDDLWHRTYGIDVTMAPLAMALLLAEAGPNEPSRYLRIRRVTVMGAVLIGLSTFQLEFDLGIPQWQALYHPVLIAAAAAITLVAARVALGRGGALASVAVFLLIRGALALLVGPGLGHTVPRFPLYAGEALAVELVYLLESRFSPTRLALLAGLAVGTVGMATEWLWMAAWGYMPWRTTMLPRLWVAVAMAVAGAVIGCALGGALGSQKLAISRMLLAGALAACALLLLVPLPRNTAPVSARMQAVRTGPTGVDYDRQGNPTPRYDVNLQLSLDPADAAGGTDWYQVTAWQGGKVRLIRLVESAPGRFHTEQPVPIGGTWKSIVFLARNDVLLAAPVGFPADPEYGQAAITPAADRQVPFVASSSLLMSESHGGAAWPAALAYFAFGLVIVVWLGQLMLAYAAVAGGEGTIGVRQVLRRRWRVQSP
jgi:hypothetical protein